MSSADEGFDPDLDSEEFRQLGYRAIDMLTEYFEGINGRRVYPEAEPSTIAEAVDESVPETGQDPETILDEWRDQVLAHAAINTSPRFFGFVMGSGSMLGAIAEALAAGTNMNVGGWHPAPSGTEVERQTIEWLAEAVGYPVGRGILTSGGTMANVAALLAAFRAQAGRETAGTGLQAPDQPGPYTLYIADHEAHSSIYRAAEMLNLGREAVRAVPSHDDFTMNVDALKHLIEADRADGDVPFCVVGQVGSINVSAIDPLGEIADVCEAEDLWFHADGACGGVGAMVPEWAERYDGMDRADSLTMDPHKWLGIPYECGSVMVRDPEALVRAFTMQAGYLQGSVTGNPEDLDLYQHGPQMSRGFRALKLWMTLKQYGLEGYRELLRESVGLARHLHDRAVQHPDVAVLQQPNLYIYSFRYLPADLAEALDSADAAATDRIREYVDELNQGAVDEVLQSGLAFPTTTLIRGRRTFRMSICSFRTTTEDIDRTFDALNQAASRLDEERRESASLPL
jgi:glutamate/tyrosine decarboxylase-like PLP-dependent enzyme